MAQSLASDFKIYPEQFLGSFVETLVQNTVLFNGASRGAILLESRFIKGHYGYESFFDVNSSLVARRDITSTSTASDTALTQDEIVSVKLNRKVGPMGVSLDAMKKVGADPRAASLIVGQMAAKAIAVDQVNSGLLAAEAALDNVANLEYDATDGTLATADLANGLAKMGDAAGQIVCWVMHSKQYFDLLIAQIASVTSVFDAWGVQILNGMPATLGRPVLVTDSAALGPITVSTAESNYSCLGLTANALRLTLSEDPTMVAQLVTGYENIFYRIQGEHAYNLQLRGFKYDVSSGGANPNDTALGTGSNWDKAVTSDKNLCGVIIKSR